MNNVRKIYRWPNTSYHNNSFKTAPQYIEDYFNEIYFPYNCLFITRCKVAIDLIILLEGINRLDEVFIQPHSPYCVIEAIGKQSVPTSDPDKQCTADIIYHQYGYRTVVNNKKRNNVLIEDAADSLILSSEEEELFPNRGRFCIFSLSKVIGADWGAIVICNDENDYFRLKENLELSNKIDKKLFSWAYENRNLFEMDNNIKLPYSYFNVNEYKFPYYNVPVIHDLEKKIKTTKNKIIENIEIIQEKLKTEIYSNNNRMPSNLVFDISETIYEQIPLKKGVVVNEKRRIYYDYDTGKGKPVNLIPVHMEAGDILSAN